MSSLTAYIMMSLKGKQRENIDTDIEMNFVRWYDAVQAIKLCNSIAQVLENNIDTVVGLDKWVDVCLIGRWDQWNTQSQGHVKLTILFPEPSAHWGDGLQSDLSLRAHFQIARRLPTRSRPTSPLHWRMQYESDWSNANIFLAWYFAAKGNWFRFPGGIYIKKTELFL